MGVWVALKKQEVLFINIFLFANPLARSKLCQNFGRSCQV